VRQRRRLNHDVAIRETIARPGARRLLVDYHERIVATSASPDRRARSALALDRLGREQSEEADRLRRIEAATPPATTFEGQLQRRVRDREDDDELETVWNGTRGHDGQSLTTNDGLGSSLAPGPGLRCDTGFRARQR
jgi:hypothetical protein